MKKSEIHPVFFVIKSVLRSFCEIRFGAIYARLRGENVCKKLCRWRKNDKYQVWRREQLNEQLKDGYGWSVASISRDGI